MNIRKIIPVSKIALLTLSLLCTSTAYASEVTGNLSSAGVTSSPNTSGTTGSISGSVNSGGGSIVTGTFGGGTSGGANSGTVTGTVTGGATAGYGSGGGGSTVSSQGYGSTVGSGLSFSDGTITNTEATSKLALISNDGSVLGASTGPSDPTDLTADETVTEVSDTASTDNTLVTEPSDPSDFNANQLAAVGSLNLGSGYWWLLLLFILVLIGYYIYRRNSDSNRPNLRR